MSDLMDVPDPAWADVQGWLKAATNPTRLLPPNPRMRKTVLESIGVSLASALGAVIWETGGLLVDEGWLRVRGAGHRDLPRAVDRDGSTIVVGDDVVGGFFAMLPPKGAVSYLAPDTLDWEPTELGYSAWLRWSVTGDLGKFYADYRARNWRRLVRSLAPDHAYSIAPPPFAKGDPIPRRSWRAVPVVELFSFQLDLRRQAKSLGLKPGDEFTLHVK